MQMIFKTDGERETFQLGDKLGQLVQNRDFIALTGDLGAGKTAFTKGIAKGLGVESSVVSPTFTIVQEYQGRLPLYHFDVYRLTDWWELEDIGYEDYFYGEGVCVVEWPQRVAPLLPKECLEISIELSLEESLNSRIIIMAAKGIRYEQLLEELKKLC